MASGKDILAEAKKYLGMTEDPPNSNHVIFNSWYYGTEVYGSPYPWCMAFVQYVYSHAGCPLPFRTASCGALLRWYKTNEPDCIIPVGKAQAGDIVIFDFAGGADTDHTGICEGVGRLTITTIDGNTGTKNEANGGAVMRRTRNRNLVRAVIRPRELEEDVDINKLISEMTPEQAYKLYTKATDYMRDLPLPTSWDAAGELREAKELGITDGSRPMALATRLETAIMCKRAVKK